MADRRARWVVFPRLHNVQYEPMMVTAMNKGVQTPTKEWLTAELAGCFPAPAQHARTSGGCGYEQGGADPDERMAESRALGLLPAPSAGSFARACTPILFFPYPISIFFLPQVHSSWLMPTEGV